MNPHSDSAFEISQYGRLSIPCLVLQLIYPDSDTLLQILENIIYKFLGGSTGGKCFFCMLLIPLHKFLYAFHGRTW